MSMLAEPRSRQKWSHDPRNTTWSRDKTKFGYQMLTKMGWSEGRGLGQNLSGNVSHIKVNKVGCNAGVGLKKSHDDDWIAHQDDFNALLSSLNGNPSKSECIEKVSSALENKVKSSKARYSRFVKSKDLSNVSSHDLACIFGQRKNCAPVTQQESDDDDDGNKSDSSDTLISPSGQNSIPEELSIKTVDSGLNMDEYFARKMEAKLQQRNCVGENSKPKANIIDTNTTTATVTTITTNIDHIEECCVTEKKKKKKKRKLTNEDIPLPSECVEEESNSVCKSKSEGEELVLEMGLVKKKKKKKRKDDVESVQNCTEQVEVVKKKKKKKKENRSNDDKEAL